MWKIYYYLRDNCIKATCNPVDPDTLPAVMATDIQQQIDTATPDLNQYTVEDSVKAVDFRFHYSVNISREVRDQDMKKFREVIETVWKCKLLLVGHTRK